MPSPFTVLLVSSSLPPSLSLTHTLARTHAHTHTHHTMPQCLSVMRSLSQTPLTFRPLDMLSFSTLSLLPFHSLSLCFFCAIFLSFNFIFLSLVFQAHFFPPYLLPFLSLFLSLCLLGILAFLHHRRAHSPSVSLSLSVSV